MKKGTIIGIIVIGALTTLLIWGYIQQTTAMSLNPTVEEIRQECIDRFTRMFEVPSEDNINICVSIVLKGLGR
jgi:hypothetical protein